MTGLIGRWLLILCCFLFDSSWKVTHFSEAWTLESPVFFSQNGENKTRRLFHRAPPLEFEASRRSVLKLAPALAGMTLLGSQALAEVDPFAAMDDMLSSGGLPEAPGSVASGSTTQTTTTSANPDKSAPPQTTKSASNDMDAALQESKKRRTIDPRTHG